MKNNGRKCDLTFKRKVIPLPAEPAYQMKVEGAAAPSTPLWSFLTSEGNRYFVYSSSAKRTSYAVKYTTMSSVGASRAIPNYYCNSLLAIRRCFTSISFNSNIVITRNAYNKPCMPSSNLICSICRRPRSKLHCAECPSQGGDYLYAYLLCKAHGKR